MQITGAKTKKPEEKEDYSNKSYRTNKAKKTIFFHLDERVMNDNATFSMSNYGYYSVKGEIFIEKALPAYALDCQQ